MLSINHREQNWIDMYPRRIVELGIDSPWVEGKDKIKKASLYFVAKFW